MTPAILRSLNEEKNIETVTQNISEPISKVVTEDSQQIWIYDFGTSQFTQRLIYISNCCLNAKIVTSFCELYEASKQHMSSSSPTSKK